MSADFDLDTWAGLVKLVRNDLPTGPFHLDHATTQTHPSTGDTRLRFHRPGSACGGRQVTLIEPYVDDAGLCPTCFPTPAHRHTWATLLSATTWSLLTRDRAEEAASTRSIVDRGEPIDVTDADDLFALIRVGVALTDSPVATVTVPARSADQTLPAMLDQLEQDLADQPQLPEHQAAVTILDHLRDCLTAAQDVWRRSLEERWATRLLDAATGDTRAADPDADPDADQRLWVLLHGSTLRTVDLDITLWLLQVPVVAYVDNRVVIEVTQADHARSRLQVPTCDRTPDLELDDARIAATVWSPDRRAPLFHALVDAAAAARAS